MQCATKSPWEKGREGQGDFCLCNDKNAIAMLPREGHCHATLWLSNQAHLLSHCNGQAAGSDGMSAPMKTRGPRRHTMGTVMW